MSLASQRLMQPPTSPHKIPSTSRIHSHPSTASLVDAMRPALSKTTSRPVALPSDSSRSASHSTPPTPVQPVPNKDTSSSSGKVFAKPSKQWILPERAKPGRKVNAEEPDDKRQSQNRISQRAHRARRTDYITTLEGRLRQYEADEIHSNVRLQEVARALKADNERMKREMGEIQMTVSALSAEKDAWQAERRSITESLRSLQTQPSIQAQPSIQTQPSIDIPNIVSSVNTLRTRPHSDQPVVASTSREPLLDCPICPNPDPDCPCQQPQPPHTQTNQTYAAQLDVLTLAAKAIADEEAASTCGLCESVDDCLCRVVVEKDVKPVNLGLNDNDMITKENDGCGLCTDATFCACKTVPGPSTVSTPRTTVVIGASTMAVPLRLRPRDGHNTVKIPVWSIEPVSSGPAKATGCSGDPNNCDACRDDSFGREFCSNLLERPATKPAKSCSNCPGGCMNIQAFLSSNSDAPALISTSFERGDGGTMRPDEAWKTLKAHPNAKFASLTLLADVVAGRTRCVGPRVELSPVPELGSPESTVIGVKRRLEVESSGVREALRLLDATSGSEIGTKDGRERKRRRGVEDVDVSKV